MDFLITFLNSTSPEVLRGVERFTLDSNDVAVWYNDGTTQYLENVLSISVWAEGD